MEVSRELKVEILFEGQAADEVRLEGSRQVDLTFSAKALDKDVAIKPQWKGQHGTFQIQDGGKKVRFSLDPGEHAGSVLLVDETSGASDEVSVVQK